MCHPFAPYNCLTFEFDDVVAAVADDDGDGGDVNGEMSSYSLCYPN